MALPHQQRRPQPSRFQAAAQSPKRARARRYQGYPFTVLLQELARLEWLKTSGHKRFTVLMRVPARGGVPVRMYVLTPKIWE